MAEAASNSSNKQLILDDLGISEKIFGMIEQFICAGEFEMPFFIIIGINL